MSADQVEPVENKTENKSAGDAGSSDAKAKATDDAQPTAQKEAETASNSLRDDSGITGTTKTDSDKGGADNEATDTVVDEAAEAETDKLQTDADLSDPTNLEQLRKMDPSQLTDAQRRALGLPVLAFLEGADVATGLRGRTIDLDGRTSVKEGESRKTNDAVIKIDGVELARFDDADTFEGQLEADIKVTLPDNAVTRDIEGVGKYSVIEGEDGSKTEIIQADDGSVMIKHGEEFVKMSTGYWGVVTEGADAKESFEAMSEKIETEPAANQPASTTNTSGMSAEDARLVRKLDAADAGAGLMLPAMAVTEGVDSATDGVRDIDVDGKVSVEKGETRVSDDAIIKHDGKTIIEFDDADILENQWSADIKVNLPESAKTKTVDGAGKHSILESDDGVATEIIESESGEVFVRKGNEYIHMSTGFEGVVKEGAEAKAAFEAEAKKYDLGAKSYDIDMRLDTKGTVMSSDGSELVRIGQDGKVTTTFPEDAYINQSGNSTYAMLNDGTEMIKSENGTTIRNTDGTYINVDQNGEVTKGTDGENWDNLVTQFEAGDVKVAKANDVNNKEIDYQALLADDFYELGMWMPMETGSGGYILNGDISNLDSADLFMGMGQQYGSSGGEPIDLNLSQASDDLTYADYFDFSFDKIDNQFRSQNEVNTRFGKPEQVEGLKNQIGDKLSDFNIPGEGTAVERIDAIMDNGIPGAEEKLLEDGSKVQIDEASGIKRIETKDGKIMLEFDRKADGKDPITISREKGEDGHTREMWSLGRGENGKYQILRRSGRDTWRGYIDGMEVSQTNGAETIRDRLNRFNMRIHGCQRRSGETEDGEFVSDGKGNAVVFGKEGEPATVHIGDQEYTFSPTGQLLNADGQPVQSGDGVNYEINDKGEMVINGSLVIAADRASAVLNGADGTEHHAGHGVWALGTDQPDSSNPNFTNGVAPPDFELDRETAGDGERPRVGIDGQGNLTGPDGGGHLDPDTGEFVFTDNDGNKIGSFNINTGDGQVGRFKFDDGGVQDLDSGLGFNSSGDVYDYNRGSTIYSDDGGWNASYGGYAADSGYNSPEAIAEREAAQGSAQDASGKASLVNANVKGFAGTGDLGNILSAQAGVADALNCSSGALAQAMAAGDAFAISVARSALSEALSANSLCQQAIGIAKRFETIAGPASGDSVTMSYLIKKGTSTTISSEDQLIADYKLQTGDVHSAAVKKVYGDLTRDETENSLIS